MVKGALIKYESAFGAPLANVVVFQLNPETLRHTWSHAASDAARPSSDPLAVPGVPNETFSFELAMDVSDQLSDPDPMARAAAETDGIHGRLAALEMLLFPTESTDELLGDLGIASGGESRTTPAARVPAVLFVWGPGRILPVRVTSLTVTERLFADNLNPTHANAQIELRVLTPDDIERVPEPMRTVMEAASLASGVRRLERAVANLGDAGRAVIGMVDGNSSPR